MGSGSGAGGFAAGGSPGGSLSTGGSFAGSGSGNSNGNSIGDQSAGQNGNRSNGTGSNGGGQNTGEPSAADELMLVSLIAGLLLGTILLLWVMTERIQVRMRRLVSLDPLTGASVFALIKEMNRDLGLATVMVTHNYELAALMDRCFTLRDGLLQEIAAATLVMPV